MPDVADPLSPTTFVNKINVPTFMACQWTDEQTGGHCPTLAEHMSGTDKKWFTYTNGVHTDSLDPETYNRLYDFLSIYVAQQAPGTSPFEPIVQASWPIAMQSIWGIQGPGGSPPVASLPTDPIQTTTDPERSVVGIRSPAIGSRPLRQRRGELIEPGMAVSGLRTVLLRLPDPRHPGPLLVPRSRRCARGKVPRGTRADGFTWNSHALAETDFSGDTGAGEERPLDRDAAI